MLGRLWEWIGLKRSQQILVYSFRYRVASLVGVKRLAKSGN